MAPLQGAALTIVDPGTTTIANNTQSKIAKTKCPIFGKPNANQMSYFALMEYIVIKDEGQSNMHIPSSEINYGIIGRDGTSIVFENGQLQNFKRSPLITFGRDFIQINVGDFYYINSSKVKTVIATDNWYFNIIFKSGESIQIMQNDIARLLQLATAKSKPL